VTRGVLGRAPLPSGRDASSTIPTLWGANALAGVPNWFLMLLAVVGEKAPSTVRRVIVAPGMSGIGCLGPRGCAGGCGAGVARVGRRGSVCIFGTEVNDLVHPQQANKTGETIFTPIDWRDWLSKQSPTKVGWELG
jgi:hypothetical protein